jgi:hypothetical protein
MNLIGGLLGGVVGGLIGAAIWIAIGYWTGYEVGWIAWGIGALVGLGVYLGGRRAGGLAGGGTAAILAIAAVLAGKWAIVRIDVAQFLAGDDVVISAIADVIIAELEEQGEPVYMPPEPMAAESISEMYPTSIWMQATRRWQALDAQQQDELRALPALANDQFILVYLADSVVEEYEAEGRALDWPPAMNVDTAWRAPHYPPEVWAEAVRQWEEMTPADQAEYSSSIKAFLTELVAEAKAEDMADLTKVGFMQSFSLFDILWAVLAVGTAAKLGAAGARVEAAETAAGEADQPE